MGLLLPSRNLIRPRRPLAFPSGVAPGFDATHIAHKAGVPRFSGIAIGSNFINLLSGKPGTIGGSPTSGIDGVIGPRTTYTNAADVSTFSGQSIANDAVITLACIAVVNVINGRFFTSGNSGSTGVGFGTNATAGGTTFMGFNGVTNFNGPLFSVGVPYFIAGSFGASSSSMVVKNLANGSVISTTGAGQTGGIAPAGTYAVGNRAGASPATSGMAAVMFAASSLSLQDLLFWANDPWSYWYPQK